MAYPAAMNLTPIRPRAGSMILGAIRCDTRGLAAIVAVDDCAHPSREPIPSARGGFQQARVNLCRILLVDDPDETASATYLRRRRGCFPDFANRSENSSASPVRYARPVEMADASDPS